MRRQPVLGNARIIDQSAFNHVPAHRTLQSAEDEKACDLPCQRSAHLAAGKKPEVRQQKDTTDQPAGEPVCPFPPEDELKARECHVMVAQTELGRLLVFGEECLPMRVRQRRQGADQRLPFDDGKAGMREPRHAADDKRDEHH